MRRRCAVAALMVASVSRLVVGDRAVVQAQSADAVPAVIMKGIAPVSAVMPRVRLRRPTEADLANGLHLMVLEDHRLPQVHFTLVIRGAGGYFDAADGVGLATLTAQMLSEGSGSFSTEEIARRLDATAAALDMTAGPASPDFAASGVCPAQHFPDVITLAADLVLRPSFPVAELEHIKQRTRASLIQDRANPFVLASRVLLRALYGDGPAGRAAPSADVVDNASVADLRSWHRERYVANRSMLAVAGDVSYAAVRRLAAEAFGSWRADDQPIPTTGTGGSPDLTAARLVERPHSVQTNLLVGVPAVARSHHDYAALLMMNQILGAGPTGRLFVRLREEKGYTYGAFSQLLSERTYGSWYARTEVGSAVTKPALRDLMHEVERLREERIPEPELHQQQRAMLASFALTLESPQQMLGYHVTRWQQQLPSDYWDLLQDRISEVTAADVQRVAARYLDAGRLQIVAVGEHDIVLEAIAGLGPHVRMLDVSHGAASDGHGSRDRQ